MTETTYPELLGRIEESVGRLGVRERVGRLYGLIVWLLGRLEQEDEELTDETVLSTPQAVRELRRAAAGETVDVDAVFDRLTTVGLYYSEDQDPKRHVVSQTGFAAAVWLRLLTGRDLRATVVEDDGELVPPFAPSTFTQVVDLLAWTRSGQVYVFWEDAATHPDLCDLPAATHELAVMHRELTR